jgi:uncharacterized protein YkwD
VGSFCGVGASDFSRTGETHKLARRFLRAVSLRPWAGLAAVVSLSLVACGPAKRSAPATPPSGPLSLEDARRFVLDLVNRDRAELGLEPVELDDVASDAGQRHAEDMARVGFTAHWGSDGSVPEQRYTEAGGEHLVHENAACFFDGTLRELDPEPRFVPQLIEKIQHAFMSEVPPHDGHKKNILIPTHNRLGVGIAKPLGVDEPCLAQEFVDVYGEFDDVPKSAKLGDRIEVSGSVSEPASFGAVGIARSDLPEPMSPKELNATSTYAMPTPYATFFPEGFVTPRPVRVEGARFEIELELDKTRGPGRYSISVWGRFPGKGNELSMVSLRTLLVR